ncbi:MAG: DUF1330 domain-containing protein [Sneathiella sp.]|uniref:DUF1330 domain-containing protein n=1 Tax=Sneathiella sp. TaxID=1964365 RepID=UPI003001FAF1
MKGYWIVNVTITDAENYPQYLAADAVAFEKYEAKFLIRGGQYSAVEGPARERHVVIEFDSYQTALDCYNSPEYQKAAKLRQKFADSEVLILEGAP